MNPRLTSVLLPALLAASINAQEPPDMSPAKELARFAPLIGNWAGTGKMAEPNGVETTWTAEGTYQWCLNKHFVQEDFVVRFEGNPVPMMFRNYLGWDREGKRYVVAVATNEGVVRLNEISFLPDGTMLQFMQHTQAGMPYVERARTKITGDSMSMAIDLLMPGGASMTIIDSTLKRSDKSFEVDWGEDAWMGAKPHDDLKKVAVIRGRYELKGEMVMVPGTPAMKITGEDAFSMVWDGNVMHGRTEGFAEGAPDAYESHAFWGWDKQAGCMRTVFVDNMGQVGQMDVRWTDGQLVSTSTGTMNGVATLQRFVVTLGRKGQLKSGVGTTVMGTMDPFVSFKATYKKRG